MFQHFRSRLSSFRSLATVAVASLIAAAAASREASAQGIVDLRLVGPASPIIPGDTFEVKLRAERQNPSAASSFVAIDCIVGWNPAQVQFLGITTAGSVPLSSSYLPTPANDYTGINEANPPADGSLLYYALTPLGQPRAVPSAGVQVVTFRFKSISTFTLSSVWVIDNLNILYPTETIVYDGVVPGVDDFGIGYAAAINQLDCSTIFWYRDSDGDGAGDPSDSTTSCTQPTGYVSSSTDNCPTNAALLNPVTYYADADADGFGNAASTTSVCQTTAPSGYVTNSSDCNDSATMYADGDGDGYGAGAKIACGGVSTNTDCNNANAAIHPGATENCANDGVDNDCDGEANSDAEAVDSTSYFVDGDADGFGAGAATKSCTAIAGSVTNNADCNDALTMYADGDSDTYGAGAKIACGGVPLDTDCDDAHADVYPGATEDCANDGVDNDCDGEANSDAEAVDSTSYFVDGDHDGFGAGAATKSCTAIAGSVTNSTDCDDASGAVYPGAVENCANLSVDNDCDGSTAESEAIDRNTYYRDQDSDGSGDPNTTTLACSVPGGYVANANDQCPTTAARIAPATWYGDADGDGAGDASVTQSACDAPSGYVAAAGDACTSDGSKTAPGACGCGSPDTDSDSDGNPDCYGQVAAITLASNDTFYAPGEQIAVRVSMGASGTGIRSANLSIHFDATRLSLASATPVAGSAFSDEASEVVDNTAGSLRYIVQVPSANAANTAAVSLADLVFDVRAGAAFCGTSGLVGFGSIGGVASDLTTTTTVPMNPTVSGLGAVSLLSLPPGFSGVPANASVAADAGATDGALLAPPTVTASDFCGNPLGSTLAVTYPDLTTGTAWPAGGVFPIGTTTLEWSATDAVGQSSSVTRTVTVANHQLLDVSVALFGSITHSGTRSMRVKAGGTTQVFEVPLTAGSGTIAGVQVPVAASYPCVLVKDPQHSLSKSASASVSGTRYTASCTLTQGDSNDDDFVDILDFGIFVGSRGGDASGRAPSNFNCDAVVNNGDFAFVTLSFLSSGDSCGSYAPQGQPTERISVRELRRRGLGHLAKADLNQDGWLDTRDIAVYMQR